MSLPPASLLAVAGIAFIGAFAGWKASVAALQARRAATAGHPTP